MRRLSSDTLNRILASCRTASNTSAARSAPHPPLPAPMLLGTYTLPIDSAGQVHLPETYRPAYRHGAVLTPGFDGCLQLHPLQHWQHIAAHLAELVSTQAPHPHHSTGICPHHTHMIPDPEGYVYLPAPQRQRAHLTDQVLLAGLSTYIEIWSPQRWHTVLQSIQTHVPTP